METPINYLAFSNGGRDVTELDADYVAVTTPDGTQVELRYRPEDGKIIISTNGAILILYIDDETVQVRRTVPFTY